MDNTNSNANNIAPRREFTRNLAQALAKMIAANDYAAEVAHLESGS